MDDFIRKLSIETELSYEESKSLVTHINKIGHISEAKEIYDMYGYGGLFMYYKTISFKNQRL